jgi:hypothetical protein
MKDGESLFVNLIGEMTLEILSYLTNKKDLVNVASVNKHFNLFSSDKTLWCQLLARDFNVAKPSADPRQYYKILTQELNQVCVQLYLQEIIPILNEQQNAAIAQQMPMRTVEHIKAFLQANDMAMENLAERINIYHQLLSCLLFSDSLSSKSMSNALALSRFSAQARMKTYQRIIPAMNQETQQLAINQFNEANCLLVNICNCFVAMRDSNAFNLINIIVDNNPDIIHTDFTHQFQQSFLIGAVSANNLPLVKLLLEKGANPNQVSCAWDTGASFAQPHGYDMRYVIGPSALYLALENLYNRTYTAASQDCCQIITLLLNAGACPRLACSRHSAANHETPYDFCLRHYEFVQDDPQAKAIFDTVTCGYFNQDHEPELEVNEQVEAEIMAILTDTPYFDPRFKPR